MKFCDKEAIAYFESIGSEDNEDSLGGLKPLRLQSITASSIGSITGSSPLLAPSSLFSPEHKTQAHFSPKARQEAPKIEHHFNEEEELRLLQKECQYTRTVEISNTDLKKLEWSLQYHLSLTLFMLGHYEEAHTVSNEFSLCFS